MADATIAFQIIASVGTARSYYIEAIHAAHDGEFSRAAECIAAGEEAFLKGHNAHSGLIQAVAAGEETTMDILLAHAEDQLMSAEGFGILAKEFLSVYRRIENAPDEF